MVTAAILQPSYLSWPGHFYWMKNCDIFIFLDDVQYTRQDWRNRNYIKSPKGKQLLTIPVHWYGNSYCLINQMVIAKQNWANKHLNSLRSAYGRAPYFDNYFSYFEDIFSRQWHYLSELTITTMKDIAAFIDIHPKFIVSSDLKINVENSTEKLVRLCQTVGADTYLAGRRGYENYIDRKMFNDAGIKIIVKDYEPIEYPQLWGNFISHLSVVDMLFNCGPTSIHSITGNQDIVSPSKYKVQYSLEAAVTGIDEVQKTSNRRTRSNDGMEKSHMRITFFRNEYDSCFFKREIYSFSLLPADYSTSSEFQSPVLPQGLIIGRIPVGNLKALQETVKLGFDILCPMAELELYFRDQSPKGHDEKIRVAELSDHIGVMNVAEKGFSVSRFHREQTMSADANAYHKKWAENCLNGNLADVVLVSRGADRIDGFIAAAYNKNKKEAKVVLIGVLSEKQDMGVGKSLLNAGIKWAKDAGAAKLCVRTEADNDAALAFYLKNGFRLKELSFYLRKDNISKQ